MPAWSSRAASRCTWVDFPQPSEPSNVMNAPRAMLSECQTKPRRCRIAARYPVGTGGGIARNGVFAPNFSAQFTRAVAAIKRARVTSRRLIVRPVSPLEQEAVIWPDN
jgi:hypothetical protein